MNTSNSPSAQARSPRGEGGKPSRPRSAAPRLPSANAYLHATSNIQLEADIPEGGAIHMGVSSAAPSLGTRARPSSARLRPGASPAPPATPPRSRWDDEQLQIFAEESEEELLEDLDEDGVGPWGSVSGGATSAVGEAGGNGARAVANAGSAKQATRSKSNTTSRPKSNNARGRSGGGSRSPTVAKTASKTKTSSISPRLSSPKAARRPSSAVPSRRAPPRDETKEVRAPSGGGGDVPSATHFLAGQRRPQSANPKTNANTTSVLATVDAAEEGGESDAAAPHPADDAHPPQSRAVGGTARPSSAVPSARAASDLNNFGLSHQFMFKDSGDGSKSVAGGGGTSKRPQSAHARSKAVRSRPQSAVSRVQQAAIFADSSSYMQESKAPLFAPRSQSSHAPRPQSARSAFRSSAFTGSSHMQHDAFQRSKNHAWPSEAIPAEDLSRAVYGDVAESVVAKGLMNMKGDVSYRRDRPLSAPGPQPTPASIHNHTRGHAHEGDRVSLPGPTMKPSDESVLLSNGKVAELASQEYAMALAEGVIPESNIPARFHLFTQSPLQHKGYELISDQAAAVPKYQRVVFPSKRPSSRWEVIQLAQVFDAMVMEANAEANGMPPSSSAHELAQRDPSDAIVIMWDVYQIVCLELVRHVWVHCTERGVLLERIRKSTDMVMAYARQMLNSYWGHLRNALDEIALGNEAAETLPFVLQELEAEKRASKILREDVKALENQIQSLGSDVEELKQQLLVAQQQKSEANSDRDMYLKQAEVAEFMLKKYEKETGLAQDESLQTRAELKRHDQYHAILTERNKYLEDRVAVIPPLQDELDQMHNVSKVLMWRNREPVELDVLCQCAGKAGQTLVNMGGDHLTRGLGRAANRVAAAILANTDAEASLGPLSELIKNDRNTAAQHLLTMATEFKDQYEPYMTMLIAKCMTSLCYALKTLSRADCQKVTSACNPDVREKILAKMAELFPRGGEAPPVAGEYTPSTVVDTDAKATKIPMSRPEGNYGRPPSVIGSSASAKTKRRRNRIRNTLDDGAGSVASHAVSNSQFSSAQSRRSRLGGGASAVPISIPVLVEAKASGSLCDVGGKPEHVAYSPVPEHMALMQLDRDTLEMKFDDIYPLDSGLAAARLARDLEIAGPDDILVVMCWGWKKYYQQSQLVAEYFKANGGTELVANLHDPLGEMTSFCCVFCPGEKMLTFDAHCWNGSFVFNPRNSKYMPVHESRIVTLPQVQSILEPYRCPMHVSKDEAKAVQGILGVHEVALKRMFQFYCNHSLTGPGVTISPFTMVMRQWEACVKESRAKLRGSSVTRIFNDTCNKSKDPKVRALQFVDFLQALVRLAASTCSKKPVFNPLDPPTKAKAESGKSKKDRNPSVCISLASLLEDNFLVKCKRLDGTPIQFLQDYRLPSFQSYMNTQELDLQRCFSVFSMKLPTITVEYWISFCKRAGVMDSMNVYKVVTIFVELVDPKAQAKAAPASNPNEMDFGQFQQGVARLACEVYKNMIMNVKGNSMVVAPPAAIDMMKRFMRDNIKSNEEKLLAARK